MYIVNIVNIDMTPAIKNAPINDMVIRYEIINLSIDCPLV